MAEQLANLEHREDLKVNVDRPAGFNNKITFRKQGKHVICVINGWTVSNGETGQAVPVEYRPSYGLYGVAYMLGKTTPVACRYNGGFIQFLAPGLDSYVTGTAFGQLEWFLD